MKSKLLSFAVMCCLSLTLVVLCPANMAAQEKRARFRVTLTGFLVIHETTESLVSIDGAGDEVFALVNFAELWSTNNIFGALQRKQSLVYGDTNGRREPLNPTRVLPELSHPGWFGTVFAGSMSTTGGLRAGDRYPTAAGPATRSGAPEAARARLIPMTLWEGELRRGGAHPNAIVLLPTIWENDNVPDVLQIWNRQADAWIRDFAANSARFINGTARRRLVDQVDIVLSTIPQRNDFDRPIGMDGEAFNPGSATPNPATFIPAVMLLTYDAADTATAQNGGMVEITYHDGPSFGPGSYKIFLRLERLP